MRKFALLLALLGLVAVGLRFWPPGAASSERESRPNASSPGGASAPVAGPPPALEPGRTGQPVTEPPRIAPYDPATLEREYPIFAPYGRPGGTVERDLQILSEVLDAWRTNFPRDGNPVGANDEITAALLGRNPLGLALVPPGHPAISVAGELCDRWGNPVRFHALSAQRMELQSAGPDGRFGTDDDALWTP